MARTRGPPGARSNAIKQAALLERDSEPVAREGYTAAERFVNKLKADAKTAWKEELREESQPWRPRGRRTNGFCLGSCAIGMETPR